ncbi:MAG TPA: Fic/DOC family N-terminal domain-containing protein [Flavitalea sp.]|nr:Fic/DOC family N-terminal domain-containing protein [Flavitalea sp.]
MFYAKFEKKMMNLAINEAVSYHYDKFPPGKLDYHLFIQEILKATDALARFDQVLKNLHNNEILLAPLRNQEAVISSRIEGTISTMDEILQYEADEDQQNANVNVRPDVVETILYQRALKNAQKGLTDGYEISASFIKMMHQQLLFYGRGAAKSPGQFKIEQNYLADKVKRKINFIPISPEKLTDGLGTLFTYLKESNDPVLVKTALMHLEFEALHPFQDGNGRIGRMLITLFLWKEKVLSQPHFYISGYFEEHKDLYIDTMREVSRTGEWENWIRFFLTAVEKQATKNLAIAESIKDLYEEMKTTFSELLSSKWSLTTLDFMFTNPVFRNNKFTTSSGIPPGTAAGFTKKLLDAGYLVSKQDAAGRRPALYSFEPLMRLVRI